MTENYILMRWAAFGLNTEVALDLHLPNGLFSFGYGGENVKVAAEQVLGKIKECGEGIEFKLLTASDPKPFSRPLTEQQLQFAIEYLSEKRKDLKFYN